MYGPNIWKTYQTSKSSIFEKKKYFLAFRHCKLSLRMEFVDYILKHQREPAKNPTFSESPLCAKQWWPHLVSWSDCQPPKVGCFEPMEKPGETQTFFPSSIGFLRVFVNPGCSKDSTGWRIYKSRGSPTSEQGVVPKLEMTWQRWKKYVSIVPVPITLDIGYITIYTGTVYYMKVSVYL